MNDGGRQAGYRVCVLLMNLCVEERRLLGGTSVEVSGRTFNSSGPVVVKPLSITCAWSLRNNDSKRDQRNPNLAKAKLPSLPVPTSE